MTNHQRGADETIARVLELHEQAKAAGFGMTVQNWEYSEYVNTHAPALARTIAAVTTERDALAVALGEARERERALFDALRDSIEKELTSELNMTYPIIMGFLGFPEPTEDDDPAKMKPISWAMCKAIRTIAAAHTTGVDDAIE